MPAKDLIFTVFGIDRASNVLDKVGSNMDKMATTGAKSFGVLAAASAAGAAAIAGSMALVPLVFAGAGAAALRENAVVQKSFSDLGNTLRTGLARDAEPLADGLVNSAHEIASAYQDLSPHLRAGFAAAKPHVEALARGVAGFAREAVPDMVTAVQRAGPVFDGLEHFMTDAGRATGDFFQILSTGSSGAGQFFDDMGNLTQTLLPDVARLLVELTGLWEQHGEQATRVISGLVDEVVDLGTSAMPVASEAMGVGLDILEGILATIAPISDELGPMIGLWISLSAAMKLIDVGKGAIEGVTTTIGNFRKEIGTTAGAEGMGKVKTVATGVMGLLGGPWGIALTAAALGLAMFGQKSENAAADQRSLANALKESAGAFDANARKAIINSQGYRDASAAVNKAGVAHSQMIDALSQGGSAFETLKKKLNDTVVAERELALQTDGGRGKMSEKGSAAMELLVKLDALRGGVVAAEKEFKNEQQAIGGAKDTMVAAVPGSDALTAALKTLHKATADTAERADALNTAWKQMFGVQVTLQEATAGYLSNLADLRSKIDDTKKSVGDWQGALLNADGQVNLSTEAGRDLLSSLVEQGASYRTLAQTAFDTALKQTGSQELATQAARNAVGERRKQFIDEMIQMGFNERQAKGLADTYLGMPDDILTFLKLLGVEDFEAAVKNMTRPRTVTIHANIETGQGLSVRGAAVMFNEGGLIPGSGPDVDSVPLMATPGEFMVKRSATRRWLPLLQRINRDAGGDAVLSGLGFAALDPGIAAMDANGVGFAASPFQAAERRIVLEVRSGGARLDELLVEILQRSVRDRGGDVQLVLGGGR